MSDSFYRKGLSLKVLSEKEVLVIIPTYHEALNIEPLIRAIWERGSDYHVLVVDDGSSDGTPEIVQQMQKVHSDQLHLIQRPGKLGLGTAYITGFKWALEKGYQAIVEMDADFSHNPQKLPELIRNLRRYDAVVGSRYIKGGGTENWHPLRKLISRAGSLYARIILGVPVNDLTGGFNAWRREVLETIDLDQIKSEGYSFQIELKYRTHQAKFRIAEVPIVFCERREGQSKMSGRIVIEALIRVWSFRFKSPQNPNYPLTEPASPSTSLKGS